MKVRCMLIDRKGHVLDCVSLSLVGATERAASDALHAAIEGWILAPGDAIHIEEDSDERN